MITLWGHSYSRRFHPSSIEFLHSNNSKHPFDLPIYVITLWGHSYSRRFTRARSSSFTQTISSTPSLYRFTRSLERVIVAPTVYPTRLNFSTSTFRALGKNHIVSKPISGHRNALLTEKRELFPELLPKSPRSDTVYMTNSKHPFSVPIYRIT